MTELESAKRWHYAISSTAAQYMLIILFIYQNINVNLEATEIVDVIPAKREQQSFRGVNNYTRYIITLAYSSSLSYRPN